MRPARAERQALDVALELLLEVRPPEGIHLRDLDFSLDTLSAVGTFNVSRSAQFPNPELEEVTGGQLVDSIAQIAYSTAGLLALHGVDIFGIDYETYRYLMHQHRVNYVDMTTRFLRPCRIDRDFFIEANDQNGKRFGNFTTLEISEDGIVTAVFDNGERTDIYQLVIADFANVNGLEPRSGNAFQETDFSGQAQILVPTTAGAGSVVSGALEASTVDIAEEFTRMIVVQRAYSASAQIITTADEMLEELLRLRR